MSYLRCQHCNTELLPMQQLVRDSKQVEDGMIVFKYYHAVCFHHRWVASPLIDLEKGDYSVSENWANQESQTANNTANTSH